MKIKFSEAMSLLTDNAGAIEGLAGRAESLKSLIDGFAGNRQVFQGEGAQRMGDYFVDYHGSLLGALADALTLWKTVYGCFVAELPDVDPDSGAVIDSYYMIDAAFHADRAREFFELDVADVDAFLGKYGQYVKSPAPSAQYLLSGLLALRRKGKKVDEDMWALDAKYWYSYNELGRLLDGIEAALGCEFLNVASANEIEYHPGFVKRLMDGLSPFDVAVEYQYRSYLNPDGTVSLEAVREAVFKYDEITDVEYEALKVLIDSGACSYYDLLDVFRTHDFAPYDPEYPCNGGYAGFGPTADHGAAAHVLGRLADDYAALAEEQAASMLDDGSWVNHGPLSDSEWRESDPAYQEMRRRMELAQLFAFLGDTPVIARELFDLSHFSDLVGGYIAYDGRRYQKSDVYQSFDLGNALADDLYESGYDAAGIDWGDYGLSLALMLASMVPGLSEPMTVADAFRLAEEHRRKGARLGVATDERVEWLLALALHRLGGGGVYVETPLGWRVVAMAPDTPGSRINQAAAGREFGLDPEELVASLLDPACEGKGGAVTHDDVVLFLEPGGGGQGRDAYTGTLSDTYKENYRAIRIRFGYKYPFLTESTPIEHLPLPVLQWVIDEEAGLHG
jgi:hypothetical protein